MCVLKRAVTLDKDNLIFDVMMTRLKELLINAKIDQKLVDSIKNKKEKINQHRRALRSMKIDLDAEEDLKESSSPAKVLLDTMLRPQPIMGLYLLTIPFFQMKYTGSLNTFKPVDPDVDALVKDQLKEDGVKNLRPPPYQVMLVGYAAAMATGMSINLLEAGLRESQTNQILTYQSLKSSH